MQIPFSRKQQVQSSNSSVRYVVLRLAASHGPVWLDCKPGCRRKGWGPVTGILLGITGAMTVHFFLDVLRVTVPASETLVFSVCGAAALPVSVRLLMRRRGRCVSAIASRTLQAGKAQVITMPRVTTPTDEHAGHRRTMAERLKGQRKGNGSSDSAKEKG